MVDKYKGFETQATKLYLDLFIFIFLSNSMKMFLVCFVFFQFKLYKELLYLYTNVIK